METFKKRGPGLIAEFLTKTGRDREARAVRSDIQFARWNADRARWVKALEHIDDAQSALTALRADLLAHVTATAEGAAEASKGAKQ